MAVAPSMVLITSVLASASASAVYGNSGADSDVYWR